MKKVLKRWPLVLATVLTLSSAGFGSCEDVLECLCPPTSGNPKVDAMFSAASDLRAAGMRVQAKTNQALADLAVAVGLDAGASAEDVGAGVCQVFASAGVTFQMNYEPPKCEADIDIAAKAAAECTGEVDPGAIDVHCEGYCEGSCRGECTAQCTMPSVSAQCSGTCRGSCTVESSAECYGTCHGDCVGTCEVRDGEGNCAGSCQGQCNGYCEVRAQGSCSGACNGECTVEYQPGGCSGRCEGSCEGHCEGHCEGEVRPPSVDVECEAQVEARVKANIECKPPEVDFGMDASGLTNVREISYNLGVLLASIEESKKVLAALETYIGTLGSAAEAIIEGELSAEDAICMIDDLQETLGALGAVRATVESAAAVGTVFGNLSCS